MIWAPLEFKIDKWISRFAKSFMGSALTVIFPPKLVTETLNQSSSPPEPMYPLKEKVELETTSAVLVSCP